MRLQRAAPQLIDMAILCNKSIAESARIKSVAAKVLFKKKDCRYDFFRILAGITRPQCEQNSKHNSTCIACHFLKTFYVQKNLKSINNVSKIRQPFLFSLEFEKNPEHTGS